tara:strand:+ start:175 stop:1092 length:918 start_codon:yes stop_codon:yes gene_type:complete
MAGIGKYSHSKLVSIIKQVHTKEDEDHGDLNPAGSNTHLQFNSNGSFGGISTFTFDGTDLSVADDVKLKFGTNSDSHIEYNENGDDFLVISGSSQGVVLSGSTIQIDGTLEGASPLKIGGEVQFVGGGGAAFNFGPNNEAKILFQDSPSNALVISGSSANGGLTISGSSVNIGCFVGIGVGEGNVTHALTLPNSSDASGQAKANAFFTYSSKRYKKDVEPLESAINTISKLQGVSYNWKDTGKKDFGFIAEDVGKVIPEIVEWSADPQYANTMDYTRIISFLVEAVKEQQNKIDLLAKKLDNLSI